VRTSCALATAQLLPIDVAFVLYEFPEVSRPSAEYQIVRRPGVPQVRVEYDPRAGSTSRASRGTCAIGFENGSAWGRRGSRPARAVPRFAYKAARVVDG